MPKPEIIYTWATLGPVGYRTTEGPIGKAETAPSQPPKLAPSFLQPRVLDRRSLVSPYVSWYTLVYIGTLLDRINFVFDLTARVTRVLLPLFKGVYIFRPIFIGVKKLSELGFFIIYWRYRSSIIFNAKRIDNLKASAR